MQVACKEIQWQTDKELRKVKNDYSCTLSLTWTFRFVERSILLDEFDSQNDGFFVETFFFRKNIIF